MLDEAQREQVEAMIEAHAVNRRLSAGQKWDVALIIGAVVLGAITILGFGAAFIVERAAHTGAASRTEALIASKLRNDPDFVGSVAAAAPDLPSGTVLALAPTTSGAEPECPRGWVFYQEAAGRFLLASGAGEGLSPRAVGQTGGEERVALTIDEMPEHRHTLPFVPETSSFSGNDYPVMSDAGQHITARRDAETNNAGGNAAHNNMPPYIALYFCKKGA